MALKLDSKTPAGELSQKWSNHKAAIKVVSPANKRKLDIIIVGTGLGGASAAASLGELGYNVKVFCIQVHQGTHHGSSSSHSAPCCRTDRKVRGRSQVPSS